MPEGRSGGQGGRSGGGRGGRSGQGGAGGRGGQGGRPSGGGRPQDGAGGRRSGSAGRSSSSRRSDDRKPWESDKSSDGRGGSGRGRPAAGSRSQDGRGGGRGRRPDRQEPAERTADQKVYDGPPIPDEIEAKDLDRTARAALQNLPEKLADKVARHLVMAGLLMHEDPETAHKHALAARARATRNAMIREACGETAYAAGKFAEALSEFRAAKRMNGQLYYTPMMADCERALRRPERAVKMDTPEVRAHLDDAGQVELSIVVAGARRDMGQAEAAVRLLETEPLHSKSRADWVARLRYAYADSLLASGRREEAIEWFHRTVAVDGNRQTDAEERLASLTGDSSTY